MRKSDQINRISTVIIRTFDQLALHIRQDDARSLAALIFGAMSGVGRYYHSPVHALSLTSATNPIQSIAALFHDLVYFPVDESFYPDAWAVIEPYLQQPDPGGARFRLAEQVPASEVGFHIIKEVFGFPNGHELFTNNGSNEFLSSLVMVKKLENLVPVKVLLQIATYIEATIPFRKAEAVDINPFEKLAGRVKKAAVAMKIPLDGEELNRTIQGAVLFANQDVANFTNPDTAAFLKTTWTLLPESNPALRRDSTFTVGEYRHALQSMAVFLRSIPPGTVLHSYQGMPSAEEIQVKLVNIKRNLGLSSAYLELKLLVAGSIEALAQVSGGDAPISTFIGEVRKPGKDQHITIAPGLPAEIKAGSEVARDSAIHQLVLRGVEGPVDFTDVKTAPLAVYLLSNTKPSQMNIYNAAASEFFAGKINADEFLHRLDPAALAAIAGEIARLAPTRRDRLESYFRQLAQT